MMESIEQVNSRLLANLITFKLLINLMEIKSRWDIDEEIVHFCRAEALQDISRHK